ncbi:MAG: HEAT repeat domain-containing protein [candidate division Zixibacteria bacterium]|nr:HEAT repeat domain-containing protein [candidate division Zixibacteria bacterium]
MPLANTEKNQKFNDIALILKDFLKIIKVISMYPEDNPLPQSMRYSFGEKLLELIARYGNITLKVNKENLIFQDETVYYDRSREERLAGLFFDAGINSFTFEDCLRLENISKLLNILKHYLNAPHKTEDLVNLFWEAGLKGFSFTTVEDAPLSTYNGDFRIQEFMDSSSDKAAYRGSKLNDSYRSLFEDFEKDEDSDMAVASRRIEFDDGGEKAATGEVPVDIFPDNDDASLRTAEAAEAMGLSDLPAVDNTNLETALFLGDEYRLEAEEEKLMKQMIADDATFDMYESSAALLKELFQHESEMTGFNETAGIFEKILKEFIIAGKILEAGLMLHYIQDLEEKIKTEKPLWAERLKEIILTAGSRDYLKILTATLNTRADIGPDQLLRYLDNFGWEALSGITDLLGELEHRRHRDTLCNYLTSRGRDKVPIIARSINDKRWYVVRNAVTILARIGDDQALLHLKKVIPHENRQVRMELATALQECPNEAALEILGSMVKDPEADIREEAVKAIIARRGQKAFEVITDIINDTGFSNLGRENQQALLNAYSVIGGDHAVEFLSSLILRVNPFKDPELTFYREAAFNALILNRGQKSEKFLIKLTSSWRPSLKELATAAIKKRREIIYGG